MADDRNDDVDLARRRLLRQLAYVAPVVVSTVVVNKAQAATLSCGPSSCNPTGASCGPCLPANPCGPAVCPPRGP